MGQLWMGSRERVRIFLLPHFVSEGHPIGLISALSQLGNRVASSLSAQGLSAQGLSAQGLSAQGLRRRGSWDGLGRQAGELARRRQGYKDEGGKNDFADHFHSFPPLA